MPFHSPAFLLLCVLTLVLYYRGRETWQHAILTISSLTFYYYAGINDTLILVATVGINHLLVGLVASNRERPSGWRWMSLAVALNLLILGFFKYRAMLATWANQLLDANLAIPSVVVPLGISFYVFQLIAYQVDAQRGLIKPEPRFWRTFLYIVFFPHHQAGPIMRPAKFLPQFYGAKPMDWPRLGRGGMWILWGLTKKVLADNLAVSVDLGFATPASVSSAAEAWTLAVKYAIQIYGDFSGYSDIAVGLGLLFGYELDRNFNQPYLAISPSAFWARWHVTLSQWLRDYLYIGLGGNRRGPLRTYGNLFLTMLLGGLWHGASAMFIVWGAMHGLLLVVHRRFPAIFRIQFLGWLITFSLTVVAWVPFRAPTVGTAIDLLGSMLALHGAGTAATWARLAILLAGFLFLHAAENAVLSSPEARGRAAAVWERLPPFFRGGSYASVVLFLVTSLVDKTTYIYFRF